MVTETLVSTLISHSENCNLSNLDMSTLLAYHNEGKLSSRLEFSDNDINLLYKNYSRNFSDDERVYDVFYYTFIDRGNLDCARSCLYSRLYLLDIDSDEYNHTWNLIKTIDERILAEILPLPKSFVENLFLRENDFDLYKWKSRMHYTEKLKPYTYESFMERDSYTSFSNVPLRPGDLILKSLPLVVAPWSISFHVSYDSFSDNCSYSCFHCLSVINNPLDSLIKDKKLVSCPKRPCECNYYFCSKECFLKNGAVHALECEHLMKLKKFSEYYLNPSFVLLVCRTLIKCSLNMTVTYRVCEVDSDQIFSNEILDYILNYVIDYSSFTFYHPRVIEQVEAFSSFLLDYMGYDFCLHLTTRELVHFILVVWVNAVPFTSHLNYITDTNNYTMGGTLLTFKTLKFRQSNTPNCVINFDDSGKITVRSIYEIPAGLELTINTFLDKYLPSFIQIKKFWSVTSIPLHDKDEFNNNFFFRDLCSIRCKNCINSFCYTRNYIDKSYGFEIGNDSNGQLLNYHWECENCTSLPTRDLDILQNKAENIFNNARKLYLEGEFICARSVLTDFVNKWSGVLNPGHYLMYNSYLLLSGILMNRPGGNICDSLVYFRKAMIVADKVLPKVCHERAYLYDRLAEYMLKMKTYVRLKSDEYKNLKNMIMNSLYNCLWNWTIISGSNSYQSISAIQKCRKVAFSLNIHTFPLSLEFVINLPVKYVHTVRAATGYKVLPESFNKAPNSLKGNEEHEGITEIFSTDDVVSMAFCAAQSGQYTDAVLDVLTTVESQGINHLGTGFSLLGTVSSNLDLNFFTSLLSFYLQRLINHLDFLSIAKMYDSDVYMTESSILNLVYSIFGSNDLGINLLMILACVPYSFEKQSSDKDNPLKNVEITMANSLNAFSVKLRSLLNEYKDKLDLNVVSSDFYKFISSDIDFFWIMLRNTTSSFLSCQTALHYASSRGKNSLVEYFLKQGSVVNSLNLEGAIPLHLASYNGHFNVVKTLFNFDSKVNLPIKTGETPLHLAAYSLQKKTVFLLIDLWKNSTIEYKGPSVWHALVCGIFHCNSNENLGKDSKTALEPIDDLVSRLSKALEIAKLLIKYIETESCLNIWIWANYLPSQLLVELWNQFFENHSLFYFPKRPPSVYVVSNLCGLMERPLKTLSYQSQNKSTGIYGSLKESKYEVNNYNELNSKNDAIFASTRTFQFLVDILRGLEDKYVNRNTH